MTLSRKPIKLIYCKSSKPSPRACMSTRSSSFWKVMLWKVYGVGSCHTITYNFCRALREWKRRDLRQFGLGSQYRRAAHAFGSDDPHPHFELRLDSSHPDGGVYPPKFGGLHCILADCIAISENVGRQPKYISGSSPSFQYHFADS